MQKTFGLLNIKSHLKLQDVAISDCVIIGGTTSQGFISIEGLGSMIFEHSTISNLEVVEGLNLINIPGGSMTIDDITVQNVKLLGGSIVSIQSSGQLTITSSTFKQTKGISGLDSYVIFAYFHYPENELVISDCIFDENGYNSDGWSSSLSIRISNGGQASISNTQFNKCKSLWGGALNIWIQQQGGSMSIDGTCQFTECSATGTYANGGAITLQIEGSNSQVILESGIKFDTCTSNYEGGGIGINIYNGGQFSIQGTCLFENCQALNHTSGGISGNIQGEDTLMQISGQITFDTCSAFLQGGGMRLVVENKACVEINELIFINCSVDNTVGQGGGFSAFLLSGGQMSIKSQTYTNCSGYGAGGLYTFLSSDGYKLEMVDISCKDCSAVINAGGIEIASQSSENEILITGELIVENCSSEKNGGMIIQADNGIDIELIGVSFKDCFAQLYGGGLCLTRKQLICFLLS
ncbi:MAG: hypothetical protein EZS28_019371 [Streblomastix strix]|uniref:Right handed beta helix domain-containing protein n=1 Tax=Streblomastix strix TaxID=222440 RepID=A0A5J4VRD9_9EUKA|nr:MAG: hypothetical protein EZS28_019371 [Streblomastix strix]